MWYDMDIFEKGEDVIVIWEERSRAFSSGWIRDESFEKQNCRSRRIERLVPLFKN